MAFDLESRSWSILREKLPFHRCGVRTWRNSLAILAIIVGLFPHSASALEIFGFRFFESKEPEDISPEAQRYGIDIDVATPDADLADRLRAASRLYVEREETPPSSTSAFLARVQAEYGRLVGALYAEGYYGGTVAITVNGRDPATLDPTEPLPGSAAVHVHVDPGPRFAFGEIKISGRAPFPAEAEDRVEENPEELGLVAGAIARSAVVLSSEEALVEEWRQQGHPKARIVNREAIADHPAHELDVAIAVERGPFAVYASVKVTGTAAVDSDFVAFMTAIEPGKPFDPDDIKRAERNLRRLQVFSSTRAIEGPAVTDGGLPVTVNVAEQPRRVIGGGASYSTVDGAGLEAYWEHRNLFGRAERLRFEGRAAGIDSVDPRDFNYFAGAMFTKPGVLSPFTDFNAALTAERNALEAYTENTIRARVGLAHELFQGFSGKIAFNAEASEIEDSFDRRKFFLASIPAEVTFDARDNELEPTEGFLTRLGVEPFYEFHDGNPGVITDLEASTYWSFDDDGRFILAARAAVGSVIGPPRDEIPESRLFFAGGGGSVRGYAYRNIGPRIGDEVVGGKSYVEGALELRLRVSESLGVVPFVDAGSAFESVLPDFSETLKLGAGIGLRYYTGLGPIRADIAVPLNPGDDDPAFAVYLGLGQSF